MNKGTKQAFALLALGLLPALQNCTKMGFQSIDAKAKLAALQSGSVLDGTGSSQNSSGGPSSSASESSTGSITVPVTRFCTTMMVSEAAGRLATSTQLTLKIVGERPQAGFGESENSVKQILSGPLSVLCEDKDTAAIKSDVAKAYVTFDRCLSKLTTLGQSTIKASSGGQYQTFYAVITNEVGTVLNDIIPLNFKDGKLVDLTTAYGEGYYGGYNGEYFGNRVLYFINAYACQGGGGTGSNGEPGSGNQDCTPAPNCDQSASPLFVDMRDVYNRTNSFHLSSPDQGVWFDLLGRNAEPTAHQKVRISWFTSEGMGLIALPNDRGEVNGIDELFGDNTFGPDGKFSPNGYAALSKYDSNGDGYITRDDTVFERLRVWFDANHDGRATADELVALSSVGIEVIDLAYDASFRERDRYGNEIKYKSVTKLTDGSLRLLFDVWFKYRQ